MLSSQGGKNIGAGNEAKKKEDKHERYIHKSGVMIYVILIMHGQSDQTHKVSSRDFVFLQWDDITWGLLSLKYGIIWSLIFVLSFDLELMCIGLNSL